MTVSRRVFVKAGGLALFSLGLDPLFLARAAYAANRPTVTPGVKSTADGWTNRYCQHEWEHADTPFRAVGFGPQLPRILAGSAPSLAIDDLQAFGLRVPREAARDRLTRAFEELYDGAGT